MVIFQNKIIYMPGIPLGARRERIEDYAESCSGIQWREVKIPVEDGVILGGAVAEVVRTMNKRVSGKSRVESLPGKRRRRKVLILYFQGWVYNSRFPSDSAHGYVIFFQPQRMYFNPNIPFI